MIRKKPRKLLPQESLIRSVIAKPALIYSGVRKIVQSIDWEVSASHLLESPLTYDQLGYGRNKANQLQRMYWNEDEASRVRSLLTNRSAHQFTSVAMSMRNGTKDSRSMGWCMNSLVITRVPKVIETLELQYRSTEVILKFGGDLAFLPWVIEQLGISPTVIRFRFANLYLSGVFFPVLCSFWDPIDFLDLLWCEDRKLFAGGTRFFLRSTYKENQSFPYSPENVAHKFAWERLDMPLIRDYLHSKHLLIGKKLPTRHHPEEDE